MIEAYEILTQKDKIDNDQFFQATRTEYDMRGHMMKLFPQRYRLETKKFFFS